MLFFARFNKWFSCFFAQQKTAHPYLTILAASPSNQSPFWPCDATAGPTMCYRLPLVPVCHRVSLAFAGDIVCWAAEVIRRTGAGFSIFGACRIAQSGQLTCYSSLCLLAAAIAAVAVA